MIHRYGNCIVAIFRYEQGIFILQKLRKKQHTGRVAVFTHNMHPPMNNILSHKGHIY